MSDHPALSETKVRFISGTLGDNAATSVNLASLFSRIVGFEVRNTHASGYLCWTGYGDTATTSAPKVAAGETSGYVPSNDKTLSLIREAGVAVTYTIMVVGR